MATPVRLTIELVPRSAWFNNLRSLLPSGQWDVLRQATYKRVGNKCEICGGVGLRHPVECHEKWDYDDSTHVAKLIGLYGLCPACHECKHIGLANVRGHIQKATKHLAAVNGITATEAQRMVNEAFTTWEQRSEFPWTVDIEWVKQGITA